MQRFLITLLIGLVLGAVIGVLIGWYMPIKPVNGTFDKLNDDAKGDYAVMIGAAYAVDGNWDKAQARLGSLAEPDPAAYVVTLTERYIAEGRNPDDIRNLVRLADRLGYVTPPMQPYLPSEATP
jgi:hypothetical protein